ncbi:MAG: hypothetical protein DCC58_06520 [Chloroflexi bacterium]|nr:MAG: hypothetical protein DCC58_06520 [Chloroflexota bacterium]
MGAAPGYLEKWFVPPFCQIDGDIQPLDYYDGEYLIECDRRGEVGFGYTYLDWTDVSMLVVIYAGACAEAAEADNEAELLETCTLPAVYVGGADDLTTQGEAPYLWLALSPGTYTLCWEAYWEYYAYGTAQEEVYDYIGVKWNCEEFTIESEEVTQLVNYSDDHLTGTLDVYLTSDNEALIEDILVILFDQDGNVVEYACADSQWLGGWVSFYNVPEGNYTVTATDSAPTFGIVGDCGNNDEYETQNASKVYVVFGDYTEDNHIDDQYAVYEGLNADPDVIIDLEATNLP